MVVANNVTELIGGTPLLRLRRIGEQRCGSIFAKLEYLNPGGSVKDRAALGIVLEAERGRMLETGDTIVEATAGNTGIALAMVAVNRGYKVVLFVPEHFSKEKFQLMRALGALVYRTPRSEGMQGAIRRMQDYCRLTPRAFAASQFENAANPSYHEETSAREILEQMDGVIDCFVAGVGTGGTFSGVARYLKQQSAKVLCVAVESEGSILGGGPAGPHRVG